MFKVGKVKINDTHYGGEDLYSDGPIEDEMLEIAKSYSREDYNKVIEEKKDWAILYHFSHLRENIISGLTISSKDSVLEIGSGCGAITGALARRARKVTCIDLSMKRSLINAYRHQEFENLEIHVGNFKDVEETLNEKYDVITLIGVFEYAVGYISGSNPYEDFLHMIKKHLSDEGRIVIAIENKFGLKYWAGCREDHTGRYFEGLEGYKNTAYARTFSVVELKRLFENVGLKEGEFYYPYPDYKFPLKFFSDDYLPERGELNINHYVNFDRERLTLFDEQAVYGGIIQDGMYPYFANSFLVVLGESKSEDGERVIYTKFSNDRAQEVNVVTEIRLKGGEKVVRKIPYSKESIHHIEGIYSWSQKLEKRFAKSGLSVNRCYLKDNIAHLDYVSGETIENILDDCMVKGDKEAFFEWVNVYIEKIEKIYDAEPFESCESFKKVFGEVVFDERVMATKELNIDMLFANIIKKEGEWVVIDYEWTFDFLIPIKFLFYRTAIFYLSYSPERESFCGTELMRAFGINESEAEKFKEMDHNFQVNYVQRNHVPLHLMYQKFGKRNSSLDDYLRVREDLDVEILKNAALLDSTSWKLTEPLRVIMNKIRKNS